MGLKGDVIKKNLNFKKLFLGFPQKQGARLRERERAANWPIQTDVREDDDFPPAEGH